MIHRIHSSYINLYTCKCEETKKNVLNNNKKKTQKTGSSSSFLLCKLIFKLLSPEDTQLLLLIF